MRFPVFPALLLLLVCMGADRAIYKEIIGKKGRGLLSGAYKLLSVFLSLLFMVIICMPKRNGSDSGLRFVMWGFFVYLSINIPKIIYLLFHFLSYVSVFLGHKRQRLWDVAGYISAFLAFVVMWWGALVNRTNLEIKNVDTGIVGLPVEFDGFRIVQISDLHLGTYGNDTVFVNKVVEEINRLSPDIIVFTGDLVNRRSREAQPFLSTLSRLKAAHGVYATLGNHDYGDYNDWPDEKARTDDVSKLHDMMSGMGWQTLDDSTSWIHIGGDSLAIVGVGNISRPPFRIYGDLSKAYSTLADENIKILLSHNPDHWTDEIMNQADKNVQLTLSGHTHAMQIEVGGWSPASIKYKNWGSLCADSLGRKLYVNKGIGTEGVPFRIGATPEITLITLKAERQ